MLGKTEIKVGKPRGDGRHCDLCGCSFPAVRCDKCGSQIFCLSCDDMYHRHPKRRFHLRKAVDPTPTPQARPVLPMKASQLASTPGDPAKMPLPPPRKKKPGKSFFDSFRRGSPSSDNSPPIPKKEYSWTDRLGSIKKFMSNRPLPPLPKEEDTQELQEQRNSPPIPRKTDLSFIHKRVDDKPPQLPHRSQAKSPSRKLSAGEAMPMNQDSPDNQPEWASSFGPPTNNFRQIPAVSPTQHLNGQASRDSSERELSAGRYRSKSLQDDMRPSGIPDFPEQPNLSPTMPPDVRGYSTLKRPSAQAQDILNQSFMSVPGDHFPGMHSSSSVTDLHSVDSSTARGPQHFPNFPMPPHYPHPYPMYPQYPNYPQYFGTSFANLSTALPNTDGDFSDHSDASSFSGKKHHKHSAFGMKAKRSQSVMYDRMAYPPQYYPFGGYPPHPPLPGYGAAPWGQSDRPVETPPSPASSVRSFGRSHRSRHRKKKIVASDNNDEDDERLSVLSSPRSRTTSSSDRLRKRKTPKKFERSISPSSLTSSEEEKENQAKEDRLTPESHTELSLGAGYQTKQDKKKVTKQAKESAKPEQRTKQHGSKMRPVSHQKLKTDDKNYSPKFKKKDKKTLSLNESMDTHDNQVESQGKADEDVQQQQDTEMKDESDYHSEEGGKEENEMHEQMTEAPLLEGQWQCEHCTFINSAEHRICQVCFKTKPGSVPQSDPNLLVVPEVQGSSSAAASPDLPALNTTSESLTSDTAKEYLTPPAPAEDDSHSAHSENEGQNFAQLNSDLEQAEKELSRGLMELMKLKEESEITSSQTAKRRLSDDIPADRESRKTQSVQPEPKPAVPQTEASYPMPTDNAPAVTGQTNYQPNIQSESVSSKSIGTDSMDFEFPSHLAHVNENISAPRLKSANFGSQTQDRMSPSNSFPEGKPPLASSQKDTTVKCAPRRDSSCQTYQEVNVPQIENEIPPLSHTDNMDFQYPYNRADSMRSPQLPPMAPPGYRGFSGRSQGLMHRSHSRSSLFGDRYGDARAVPPDFDNLGFGFGPSPMYRSLSRSSLTGDYPEPWMPDARSLRRPDFYLSMEELVERRRLESKRAQGLELVRMIREAEQQGFTADDIHVALNNCGKQNPVDWLQTNWKGMVDTVVTLATNYGKDKQENDIGVLCENEARDSLRMHKGNIWAAVTECVEGRQRKFLELKARGNFSTKEIVDALTQSEGNVELAYTRMSATTLKPFLMRIWGAGEGVENQDGAVCDPTEYLDQRSSEWLKDSTRRAGNVPYADTERCSDQEDWDDDDEVEDEVSWNEDEEDEMENPENFDIEPQIINREKRGFAANNIATPESDSEYCDAFDPVGDARSATSSSPVDEIFFVSPDSGLESPKNKKQTSFLSRLAALRKNKKPEVGEAAEEDVEQSVNRELNPADSHEQPETKILPSDSNTLNSERNKIYSPLNILKQTFSAIKDSVIGSSSKHEAKHPRSITEARTIIVHDTAAHEAVVLEENTDYQNLEPLELSKHKVEDSSKIIDEHESKEKELVPEHAPENLKSNAEIKLSPTSSEVNCNASVALQKEPEQQQVAPDFDPEFPKATETSDVLNNAQNKSELVKSEESSSKISTNADNKNKPLTVETLKHTEDEHSTDLKTDVKDNSPRAKELPSEMSLAQKSAVIPDSNNTTVDQPQSSLMKPSAQGLPPEVAIDVREKNVSELDSLFQNVTKRITYSDKTPISSGFNGTEKTPDVGLVEDSDAKPKTIGQKGKLRLKIPTPEGTLSSPEGQKVGHLDTADNSLQTDTKFNQKQDVLKKENDEPVVTASGSHPVPSEGSSMPQKSPRNAGSKDDELLPATSTHTNSPTTNVREINAEAGEGSKDNISENEFHDMASKIAEKMENCLEVLKSEETAFCAESEQNVPSSLDKEQEKPAANETEQNKTNSFNQISETVKENTEKITPDIPEVPAGCEKKEQRNIDAKSPSTSLDRNETSDVGGLNQIIEASTSPGEYSSSDAIEKHAIVDTKTLVQPSTSNDISSDANRSVVNKVSAKIETEDGDTSGLKKAKSPVSHIASSSPTTTTEDSKITSTSTATTLSEDSAEVPMIFPGVKAKTFTGVINKKGKINLSGSDNKPKDSTTRSPTPKSTTDAIQIQQNLTKRQDDLTEKQKSTDSTDTPGDGHAKQPHQSETELHVRSTSTTDEENRPSSVSNDQHSQTPPVQVEPHSAVSASSEEHQIKLTEHNASESPSAVADKGKISLKSKSEDGNAQDKQNLSVAANSEAPVATSSKISDSQAKENNLAAKSGETQVSTALSKSHEKEQDRKNDLAASTSKTPVPSSSKISDNLLKEQEKKSAENNEAELSSSSKSSDSHAKEQDNKNTLFAANSNAPVSTSGIISDNEAKENNLAAEISETQVVTALSESHEKEQDRKNDLVASTSKTPVPSSSKISDSLLKVQDKKAVENNEVEPSSSSVSDSQVKLRRTRNVSATVNNEASTFASSNGVHQNAESTEIIPAQEDNIPLSPTASRDKRPTSRVEALKHLSNDGREGSPTRSQSPLRPQSPFGRMTSLSARKEAIAQERNKEIRNTPTIEKKPWFIEKVQPPKPTLPKRSIKQQLEFERKIRKLVSERKCRTYRKAEIAVQLLELNFAEEEALHAAHECSTLEQAISYLQQECLLCTGMYPVGLIVSMIHCPHKACRECIKAYFTIQIRDRTIMELLCPFCNEPDISDEDVAQDYFNHLDMLLKKLVEPEIHELFQRKLRDRVLMKDPNFRWCSQCSSGFIAMPNLKRLICPDCNAITCASCRRPWEREHEGISCEAFANWKDANDPEAQTAGLAKLLQEDGIDCPNCHFRYSLAKGGCMHFRCIQCQHDFCSGCSKPFKMGQKCGVSEYCGKLGLHAHHPRNCLFYLRDKDPEDLQRLLELNDIEYNKDPPDGMELKFVCQVMEQKETSDGLVDDICGKEVLESQAGLCRVHYVEYLGQLVNKHKIDPIQIFCNDDLELVLRRASKRLPAKSYRDTEIKYREKLVQLIQEELPLEQTEGS